MYSFCQTILHFRNNGINLVIPLIPILNCIVLYLLQTTTYLYNIRTGYQYFILLWIIHSVINLKKNAARRYKILTKSIIIFKNPKMLTIAYDFNNWIYLTFYSDKLN